MMRGETAHSINDTLKEDYKPKNVIYYLLYLGCMYDASSDTSCSLSCSLMILVILKISLLLSALDTKASSSEPLIFIPYVFILMFSSISLPPSLIVGVIALYSRYRLVFRVCLFPNLLGTPCPRNRVLVLLAKSSSSAF
jgi:hypothetical protein